MSLPAMELGTHTAQMEIGIAVSVSTINIRRSYSYC